MTRTQIKHAGFRFIICLLIIGVPYAAVVGVMHRKHAITPQQKVASLRASLDQTYLAADQLIHFSESSTVATSELNQQYGALQASSDSLSRRLNQTPSAVITPKQRTLIRSYSDAVNSALAAYKLNYALFAEPLSYDPVIDIGALNLKTETTKALTRAKAAQKGLHIDAQRTLGTASSGLTAQSDQKNASVLSPENQRRLENMSDCFGKLSAQLSAKTIPAAETVRATCISDYPALRAQLIQNLLDTTYRKDYFQSAQSSVLPILKQLDSTISKARS